MSCSLEGLLLLSLYLSSLKYIEMKAQKNTLSLYLLLGKQSIEFECGKCTISPVQYTYFMPGGKMSKKNIGCNNIVSAYFLIIFVKFQNKTRLSSQSSDTNILFIF